MHGIMQKLNEISLQFSGEAAVQEKLEDLRVAATRSSPMMEVINLVCFIIICQFTCMYGCTYQPVYSFGGSIYSTCAFTRRKPG